MLYKEWRSVRLKFALWLVVFIVIGIVHALVGGELSLTNWSHNSQGYLSIGMTQPEFLYKFLQYATPLYQEWLDKFLWAIAGCAIIAGSDIISEEKDKQTIIFLLSRPIGRNHVYNTKLFLNIAALWVAGIMGCLPVWLVDATSSKPLDPKLVLLGTGVVLIIGASVLCLTTLISIYVQNFIQTLAFSLFTVIVLYIGEAIWAKDAGGFSLKYISLAVLFYEFVGFSVAALALYFTGLSLFAKKEF